MFTEAIKENGHTLYHIYYDEGLTGTKLNNRKGFNKMLHDAGIDTVVINHDARGKRLSMGKTVAVLSDRVPLFCEIWIKNTSRFARNTLSYELIQLLRQKEVSIYFKEQNLRTDDPRLDFQLQLFQAFDMQDSRDKSHKVRSGIAEGARKGVLRTNGKIYGYRYNKAQNCLEIIHSEADVVRIIFDQYSEGKGIRQVINYLTENNFLTRNGRPFVKTTVRNILNNEKYAGMNNPLKYDTGLVFEKLTYAKVKQNYTVIPSDKIPSIIDYELFLQCQELMHGKVNYTNQKGIYKGLSKYSGRLICGNCGNPYHSNKDGARLFYNCSNKKRNGISACDSPNVTESLVDEYIDSLANGQFDDYVEYIFFFVIQEKTFRHIEALFSHIDTDKESRVVDLKEKLAQINVALKKTYDLYARSTADDKMLDEQMKNFEVEKMELSVELAHLTQSNEAIYEEIRNIYNQYEHTEALLENKKGAYTREEILVRISSIVVSVNASGEPQLTAKVADTALVEYKTLYQLTKGMEGTSKSNTDDVGKASVQSVQDYIRISDMIKKDEMDALIRRIQQLPNDRGNVS
jgi:DNA invertase Pin-like site-specific DNA recombinase